MHGKTASDQSTVFQSLFTQLTNRKGREQRNALSYRFSRCRRENRMIGFGCNISKAIGPGTDQRHTRRYRLKRRNPKPLMQRWHDKHVRSPQESQRIFNRSQKANSIQNAEFRGKLLLGTIYLFAADVNIEGLNRSGEQRDGPQNRAMILRIVAITDRYNYEVLELGAEA
jgi:hypothetical protein